MRLGPILSVGFHVAIVVWFVLQTPRLFDAGAVPSMTVDLVPQNEAPPAPIGFGPEASQPPSAKPADAAAPAASQDVDKTEAAKQDAVTPPSAPSSSPDQPPPAQPGAQATSSTDAPPKGDASAQPETPTETAAAPALPTPETPPPSADKIDAPPASTSAKLTAQEVADFKAQLQRCWSAPPSLSDPRLRVVLRTSLTSKGGLIGQPTLIAAPASTQGPALVASAMKALAQCAPYSTLPAQKYKEWRILDVSFTARGVIG